MYKMKDLISKRCGTLAHFVVTYMLEFYINCKIYDTAKINIRKDRKKSRYNISKIKGLN